MTNRLVGVLYVLFAAWAVFLIWGMLQSGPQYLATALIFGLPPLVILMLIRFVSVGRL